MGDNDKPFVCTHAGCNMRFTNEDHLSVHRMKHEMSLTLTPGAKSGLFTLADQTPTPTKFLKNCEEIGLFNELTKNPFEEAFKKASETLSEGKIIEVVNMAFPGLESESLNTPTPTTHMTSSHCPVICVMTPNKEPEYIPLPGPDTDMGSTIATTPGGSSSTCGTPQSQASTPRKSTSTPAGTPTSSMALPFKLRLKRERENELSMLSGGQSPSVPKKDVVPEEKTVPKLESPSNSGTTHSQPASITGPVSGTTSVNTSAVLQTGTNPARIAMVTPTPVVSNVTVPTSNNVMSSSVLTAALRDAVDSSGVAIPSGATASGVPYMCVAPGKQPQCYLQVMIQMPGGEMVPVQIPAAISQAAQTVPSATAPLASSAVITSQAPVTSTVAAASRTTQRVTSSGGAASTATKQKLKAALQQSVLSSNMRIMTEAVDRVATEPIQNSPASLQSSLSPISVKTTPSSYRTQNLPKMSISSQQISPASSVTTPISDIGDLDDDDLDDVMDEDGDDFFSSKKSRRGDGPDPDDRRKKFLERNRAAAARCRQKKKMWVTNLERKASDLQNTNSKLQQEVTTLRSEVAQLKTLLLAHKDCPITQKLQSGAVIKAEMDTSRPHTGTASYANTSTSPHHSQSHTANVAMLSPTGSLSTDDNIAGSSRVIHSVSPTSTTSSVLRTIQSVAPFVIEFK